MPTAIALDDLQRLLAAGAQLVEVLPREEYEEMHLPGANGTNRVCTSALIAVEQHRELDASR